MAASPAYKLFDASGAYVGAAKDSHTAAQFVAALGDGASVRDGHAKKRTLWTEGREQTTAFESFDAAAAEMERRLYAMNRPGLVAAFGEEAVAYIERETEAGATGKAAAKSWTAHTWKEDEARYCRDLVRRGGCAEVPAASVRSYLVMQRNSALTDATRIERARGAGSGDGQGFGAAMAAHDDIAATLARWDGRAV